MMNTNLNKTYQNTIAFLKSMVGCSILSAIQEQYYFEGELDPESMGTLKITLSDKREFIFDCAGDAESLEVENRGFYDKGALETDFEDNRYRWQEVRFFNSEFLKSLGQIDNIFLELRSNEWGTVQSGCKMEFESSDYLYIWTIESDNIFYGLNEIPPYLDKKNLKVELMQL